MTSRQRSRKKNNPDTYRISELIGASGATRDTIKYYLRAGLLPPAEKPRANLSLYTKNHLQLIALIRKYQEQTKLPLHDIADIFRAASYDANTIEIELLSARYRVSDDDNIIPLPRKNQSARNLDFPADFLQQLESTSLLQDSAQPKQGEEQLAVLLWSAHQAGVPLAFFERAREKLAELADMEVKALIAIKRPDLDFSEMVDNVADINRIISRWMVTEKTQQIRSQFQRVIDNSERAISMLLDTIYQPSALFRQRYGVDDALASVATTLHAKAPSLAHTHALCFACLLLGEFKQTITLGEAALAAEPAEPITIAILALAYGLQNDVELAFSYSAQLEHCTNKHPAILQARMLSALLQASQMSGITDTTQLMKSAGEIFLELLQNPMRDEPEVILTLARANVGFPEFANSQPQAIAALQGLLQRLDEEKLDFKQLPVASLQRSVIAVYRINTLYYLGTLLAMNGKQGQAKTYFEQVIQIDPASNFGKGAYLQLGTSA